MPTFSTRTGTTDAWICYTEKTEQSHIGFRADNGAWMTFATDEVVYKSEADAKKAAAMKGAKYEKYMPVQFFSDIQNRHYFTIKERMF